MRDFRSPSRKKAPSSQQCQLTRGSRSLSIIILRENTRKLSAIKESIVSNVSDLSAISEENAASSEEVSASIESVSENVTEINNQMSQMEALSAHLSDTVSFFS